MHLESRLRDYEGLLVLRTPSVGSRCGGPEADSETEKGKFTLIKRYSERFRRGLFVDEVNIIWGPLGCRRPSRSERVCVDAHT